MKLYVYDCSKHGFYESPSQQGAACPVCGRVGKRKFLPVSNNFHPSKGDSRA